MNKQYLSPYAQRFFDFKPYTSNTFYSRIVLLLLVVLFVLLNAPVMTFTGQLIIGLLMLTPILVYWLRQHRLEERKRYLSGVICISQVMVNKQYLNGYDDFEIYLRGSKLIDQSFQQTRVHQQYYLLERTNPTGAYPYAISRMQLDAYWLMHYFNKDEWEKALSLLPKLNTAKWMNEQAKATAFMQAYFAEMDKQERYKLETNPNKPL